MAVIETQRAPEPRRFNHFSEIAGFIWQVADLLRGDYKQADYGKVILPFTVLRRLDCVLEPTKAKVLERHQRLKGSDLKSQDVVLNKVAGVPFHDISPLDFFDGATVGCWSPMVRRLLARIGTTLDLARLFELPAWHPDRMIAAQVVLYIGLAIIIATTLWSHWKAGHP